MSSSPVENDVQTDEVDRFRAQWRALDPSIDTGPMAIPGRIKRIADRVGPHMEALFARHGLERGEFDVLATLRRAGAPHRLSPTDLYTSLMITSGGLTHRLARLEGAGLVTRQPNPQDGRSLLVQLTDEGLRRASTAFDEDIALERLWLDALGAREHVRSKACCAG